LSIGGSATPRRKRRRWSACSTSAATDNRDPVLVDRLAQDREVILHANRGVGASTGVVPDTVSDMARDVLRFVDALPLRQIDLLGFSLGGYIGQELALVRSRLIRRLVLAGTAPPRRTEDSPLDGRCLRARRPRRTGPRPLHPAVLLRLARKAGPRGWST
jgi:pimeloyl-ACP methyl ester carboxylesterase